MILLAILNYLSDVVTRHEKTIHGGQLQSGAFNTQARTSLDCGNVQVQAPATGTALNNQNASLQRSQTPLTEILGQDNLPSFDSISTTLSENSLDFDFNVVPEAGADAFKDMSLEFFDPFLGNIFDHFALPVQEDQSNIFEPLGLISSQNNRLNIQIHSPGIPNGTPTLPQRHAMRQGTLMPRQNCRPQILKPTTTHKHSIIFTEEMRAYCFTDLKSRLTSEQLGNFQLPDTTSLQSCFNNYVEAFHIHFPFLHLHTLNLKTAPSPLTLGICAIGALHRLERKLAASLYLTAERALTSIDFDRLQTCPTLFQDWARPRDSAPSDLVPLSLAQARLILVFFAAFSGEPQLIRQALVGCGHLSAVRAEHYIFFQRLP